MSNYAELQTILDNSESVCAFTGAGISCPSGIPDFRSADGLYRQEGIGSYSPEEIISHSFFLSHPDLFYRFYKEKMLFPDAEPNAAHRFFAELEKSGKRVSVVTQNIDGLHTKAGSREVYEIHGRVRRNLCPVCGREFDERWILAQPGVPVCPADGATVKPDVVLYEESLDDETVRGAVRAIANADVLIVIGTSLAVYPAASFLGYFRGDHLVVINKQPTPRDSEADLVFHEDVVDVMSHLRV